MGTEVRDGLLADLASVAQRINNDKEFLYNLVALALDERASWQEIGDALGITRQAAWQRFHDAVPSTTPN